ncbi:MAG: Scramblase family protein [Planctomycetaceae bacterium]|nr:Scramblase family protein [Planctomycetaceae bacterium]
MYCGCDCHTARKNNGRLTPQIDTLRHSPRKDSMLTRNQFFVKEHVGMFKLANTYDILDLETNEKIGVAKEKPSGLTLALRFFVNKQLLPTKVEIIENPDEKGNGNVLITIKRGITLLRSKIKVYLGSDKEIGYFKSKLFSFGGGFWLYDTSDKKIAEVKGDWKGWNFKLLGESGNELGTVTKKWAGLGKELFTSADNYVISINDELGDNRPVKALLLAAGIAIDTVFKEKS